MPTKRRMIDPKRKGSIYVAVLSTATLVSMIGFTAIHVARLELKAGTAEQERAYARLLAQSGVELALARIDLDSSWRNNYNHGAEHSITPGGATEPVTFRLLDNLDQNVGNDNTHAVEIQGIGRCGNATFIYSVDYQPSVTSSNQVGPLVLHSYQGSSAASTIVNKSTYTGQYFVASLPAGAVSWSVDEVDIYVRQSGSMEQTLYVKIYTSDGNGQPATLLETAAVPENSLPTSYNWYTVNFSSVNNLTPGQGLCLALEGADSNSAAAEVPYDTGVTLVDSHRLNGGSGSWSSPIPNQSILYRVRALYLNSTATGEFALSPGTWRKSEVAQ
ncbi:MAG: hypothetical protein MJA83_06225 [Gammaproteobacteria bacterium]|nr:hypothetical protein [Gammaproteobacteria bacterium]